MGFLGFGKKIGAEKSIKTEAPTKVKDPVCGMSVDPNTAPAKSEYMGKMYYFCNPGCKKTFDANPGQYSGGGAQEVAGHGGGRHEM